jgi:hypothetical protein
MRGRTALLIAAGLAATACSSAGEPHGSPVLTQVYWIAGGKRNLVWTLASDPTLVALAPPAGTEVDFVFDRRLDGNRIEDTVTTSGVEMTVPKSDPPITVDWPNFSAASFADQVLYNSEPSFGGTTAYVLLQPVQVGFPSDDTVSFSLDKTGLTSAYDDQMTGPAQIDVMTGHFSATFGLPATGYAPVSVPASFMLPIQFSNRTGSLGDLAPYIRAQAAGRDLPVSLAPSSADPTVVYLSPASCLGGWPSSAPIEVILLAGLPDAFGGGLAATTTTTFTASAGATPVPDGGCTAADAGADAAPTADAGGTADAAPTADAGRD